MKDLVTHHTYECLTCGKIFKSPIADADYVRCTNCGSAWALRLD